MKTLTATKKPVPVEAILWDGSQSEAGEIILWMDDFGTTAEYKETNETVHRRHPEIRIHTLEGKMAASPGDWIIKGVKNEFYPCKPDIFDATYDYIK
jgi:hypothetical protein